MSSEKSLLKSSSISVSGRLHRCKKSKTHQLPKGAVLLVIKEGRDNLHYCDVCAKKFIATARRRLDELELELERALAAFTKVGRELGVIPRSQE